MTDQTASVSEIYADLASGGQPSGAAGKIVATNDRTRDLAQANRAWLERTVRYLIAQGVRQFVDVGSAAIVGEGSLHAIARSIVPDARVVYADINPDAVAQLADALRGDERAAALEADLTQTEELLRRVEGTGLIDPNKPVGLLLAAVLHFVSDDEVADRALAATRQWLPSGSYLAVSHGAAESFTAEEVEKLRAAYAKTAATRSTARTRGQVAAYLGDFELVPPGVVFVSEWRPELAPAGPPFERPERSGLHVAVGRKA
ncbi:SAM-dependent methyltransferase [Micromonospora sp. NPDC049523]|uniref:SAM-dependent methyltransferase n=1 Tax=Micromonospora sp. NPDC049523 TaxID=3155921 RepID=UPI00342EA1FF